MRSTFIFSYLLIMCVLLSCRNDAQTTLEDGSTMSPSAANAVDRDLEAIKKDGVLRALVIYSSTSYFLYKGQPMGFEYELLTNLAKDLGLKLVLVVSDDLDHQFDVLNRGDVDLIAHGMTITNQRKWEVNFTEYLYLTKQVLVQKKPDNFRRLRWSSLQKELTKDPIELIGETISVRKNSAYFERLMSLMNEIGGTFVIDTLDSSLTTDEIIDKVAKGEIKYTIADENLAKINASYQPILDIKVPISFSQRIAWVTRKKSKALKAAIDDWIIKQRKSTTYYVIYNKYFKNKRSFQRRIKSDYYSLGSSEISPYDDLIKTYAAEIGWDWKLLAAQIYQESKFDPKAESWAGAKGLLQLIPSTAEALGVTNPENPEQSIKAGSRYLMTNYRAFESVSDSINRIKLTLAAYNCGLGHVNDAQRLAEVNGLNPSEWTDIQEMLLKLRYPKYYLKPEIKYGYVRGSEPVNYVNNIFERYRHYQQLISEPSEVIKSPGK